MMRAITNSTIENCNTCPPHFAGRAGDTKFCNYPNSDNLDSIAFQLTGTHLTNFNNQCQVAEVFCALDRCLRLEKTKAKLARGDYDANRHIALHQLRERLIIKFNK